MKTILKTFACGCAAIAGVVLSGCVPPPPPPPVIPSKVYADQLRRDQGMNDDVRARAGFASYQAEGRTARVRFASGELPPEADGAVPVYGAAPVGGSEYTNAAGGAEPQFYKQESSLRHKREYRGPLPLGDPGTMASLWRESRGNSDLFHDDRAWQTMDLITIVVTERSEGKNEANTEIKQTSSVLASIQNFLGFETDVLESNTSEGSTTPNIDLENLIRAQTQNNFKGEGKTDRKDHLTAKISAMVAEVLPGGVLRIEGQKIISVNSEEKVMVISGLVRPKDVNSANEVDSSKVANMRIDYFGKGVVGEAQQGSWMGRILRTIWPF